MSCQCQLISIPTRQIASQRGRTLKCTNSSPIVSASQALVVSSNQNHLANFINLVLRHTGQGKATNTPATALHCYVLIANHNARLIRAVGICGNFPVSKKNPRMEGMVWIIFGRDRKMGNGWESMHICKHQPSGINHRSLFVSYARGYYPLS